MSDGLFAEYALKTFKFFITSRSCRIYKGKKYQPNTLVDKHGCRPATTEEILLYKHLKNKTITNDLFGYKEKI